MDAVEASSPGTIEVLSSFLTVAGTIADVHFVRSVTWSMILTVCLVLMGYFLVLKGQTALRIQLRALATEMSALRADVQMPSTGPGTSDGSTTTLDDTLMRCIDAKLLDISGQTTALKTLLGSLEAQQTIARLEEIQDALSNHRVTQEQLLESVAAIAPKMTAVQGVADQLSPMSSAQQSMALDTKKGFAATETHIDGVLKAQQDTMRCLQSETKELKDKLIKIDTVCDGLTASAKQLSLDVHVSRTKQEQKMDNYIQDYNKFQGATNSNLRALGPVMPAIKTVTDHLNNAMDYLAKAWQSYERTEPVIHNMQEQVNNIEDRLLRIESLVGGNTDTANECSDMIQQLKESQNLLHDNLSQVLERLPKLPKRQPPSQEAPPASTSSQAQVPQQQPPTPIPVQTSVDTGIPLRLSEHLMPVYSGNRSLSALSSAPLVPAVNSNMCRLMS